MRTRDWAREGEEGEEEEEEEADGDDDDDILFEKKRP